MSLVYVMPGVDATLPVGRVPKRSRIPVHQVLELRWNQAEPVERIVNYVVDRLAKQDGVLVRLGGNATDLPALTTIIETAARARMGSDPDRVAAVGGKPKCVHDDGVPCHPRR